MNQKRLIGLHNAPDMLKPSLIAKDRQFYTVFELKSDFIKKPTAYDFCVFNGSVMTTNNFDYTPTRHLLGILNALEPILEDIHFQPIAFVRATIIGPLVPTAYGDIQNCEYDISRHKTENKRYGRFAPTRELGKFIFRDKENNFIIPMPYYVSMHDFQEQNKPLENKEIHTKFIQAVRQMYQKQ